MDKVFVRHTVKDYSSWHNVFSSVKALRKAAGEKSFEILVMDDDPKHIIGIFEWDNLDNAKQFFKSGDLKQKMDEAGVTMRPEIFYCTPKDSGQL